MSSANAEAIALRVALQTMKERCISLQQKLTVLEEENLSLRAQCCDNKGQETGHVKDETEVLYGKVAELTRQKFQLTEHIAMVATENRQLWQRLSQLTREKTNSDKVVNVEVPSPSATSQNLIRSKTFTQHSPNPLLRLKPNISSDELSLEEVSLRALNELLDAKAEMERQCEEMGNGNSLGFAYLNDEASDGDLNVEAKTCNEGMLDIKRELLKQQSDLKVVLSSLKQRKVVMECQDCKMRRPKPEMADKNLETEDNLLEPFKSISTIMSSTPNPKSVELHQAEAVHIDILEQKRLADAMDKMCPMCGRIFTSSTMFDDFQEHVEMHFLDDSDLEPSLEKTFELVSSAVGNF